LETILRHIKETGQIPALL